MGLSPVLVISFDRSSTTELGLVLGSITELNLLLILFQQGSTNRTECGAEAMSLERQYNRLYLVCYAVVEFGPPPPWNGCLSLSWSVW